MSFLQAMQCNSAFLLDLLIFPEAFEYTVCILVSHQYSHDWSLEFRVVKTDRLYVQNVIGFGILGASKSV
jgi:hypothetical protein